MNEIQKTMTFIGVAAVLGLIALLVAPGNPTPEAFSDRGEEFFPDFTDPNAATSMEVIDFNEETGSARPFKVLFKGGQWTIPSHHNYPADGKDRLAQTAAGILDIKKDDIVAEVTADHEALGVVDPLDETVTSLTGRGKRVTIKDKNDNTLADIIIGKSIPGRDDQYRYARLPGQKRTYAARFNVDITTTFNDWIEKDLLLVDQDKITQVTLKDYSINERTGLLNQRDTIILTKEGTDWTANKMRRNQKVDDTKMTDLLKALDELTIVGVRPKPAGLSRSLAQIEGGISITRADMLSLQSKGFYFTQDGQLVSNEGETQVRTGDGVTYTLRFGEIVYGEGDVVTAGLSGGESEATPQGPGENRYLFITTEFDPKMFPEPRKPSNTAFQSKADSLWTDADRTNSEIHQAHEAWREQVEAGRKLSADLNARFALWYYVISSESFDKISLERNDLITAQ